MLEYSGIPAGAALKNLTVNTGDKRDVGWEDPLEKEMTTHLSIMAWKIPWREKPGRLRSMVENSRA